LKEAGISFIEDSKQVSLKLKGMTFVVTGALSGMSRDQAKERIRQNGGKVVNAVSKSTSYLVMGGHDKVSTKEKDAKKHGVKIIQEEEFLKLIEP